MFELTQDYLDTLFPATRTNEFFEALFGDADDGAYDIKLVCNNQNEDTINLHYELHGRVGKCLACNLTSGLPQVFRKHPILAVEKTVNEIAQKNNWTHITFDVGNTVQVNDKLHFIPVTIKKN